MNTISVSGKPLLRLTTLLVALGILAQSADAQGAGAPLLTTITNPTPANSELFGGAVAALGNDRVLVGAEGATEAYLFSLNGTVLTTFTMPDPDAGSFGAALTALGEDRVIAGAYNYVGGVPLAQVGRAYLYDTNGVLLTTFTNPAPATVQAFGWSVAAMGNDRVLVGTGDGGVAYLFRTNGTLLTTFTKPFPAAGGFGLSVAAVGIDRVLIGAPYDNTGASGDGVAYLFNTNGALLTTFTNPVPATGDNFGTAIAAVGNDRILISAIDYGAAKGTGGAAYLFNTNGTLLTTFTNPTPASGDYFGWSVAAVGSTRVLIGAYQDGAGAFRSGAAYVFTTNGALLTTITNPTPALNDYFGLSVAAVGGDRVIIGGNADDTGATDSGTAYLFALSYPPLSITRNTGSVSLSWVTAETGLLVQQADSLGSSVVWSDTTNSVSVMGLTNVVQQTLDSAPTNRFYRLHRP